MANMLYHFRVLLDRELSKYPHVLDFCKGLYDDRYRSPYLMGYMVDTYEEMLEQGCENKQETLNKASEVPIILKLYYMYLPFAQFLDTVVK